MHVEKKTGMDKFIISNMIFIIKHIYKIIMSLEPAPGSLYYYNQLQNYWHPVTEAKFLEI